MKCRLSAIFDLTGKKANIIIENYDTEFMPPKKGLKTKVMFEYWVTKFTEIRLDIQIDFLESFGLMYDIKSVGK